jgi:hypothetical protein
MGLDCSHDAFSGAYSSFMRFRIAVCKATGGRWDEKDGYFHFGEGYDGESHPGLMEFLGHSDCDGEISPEMCNKVANDLEPLIPKLEAMGSGGGHLERNGGYAKVLRQFVDGCRAAASENEPLIFG